MNIVKLKLQAEIYHSFKLSSEYIFHYNCGILSLYVEPLPIKNNRDGPKLSSSSPVPNPASKSRSQIQVPNPEERDWDWGWHYNPAGHPSTHPTHQLLFSPKMSIQLWEKTIHDLSWPSLTFHDLPWPSLTFYDLLSPSKTSMTFYDQMSIVKT